MFDFLRRIARALINLCRRRKPRKGPPPLFVVLRMGDHLVMVLARHRGHGIEQWTWIWPLAEIQRLKLQLLLEAVRPDYFEDWKDPEMAWKYALQAAREWERTPR